MHSPFINFRDFKILTRAKIYRCMLRQWIVIDHLQAAKPQTQLNIRIGEKISETGVPLATWNAMLLDVKGHLSLSSEI